MLQVIVLFFFSISRLLFRFIFMELFAYLFNISPRGWRFQKVRKVRFKSWISYLLAFQKLERRYLWLFFPSSIIFLALEDERVVVSRRTFPHLLIFWHFIIISPRFVVGAKLFLDCVVRACVFGLCRVWTGTLMQYKRWLWKNCTAFIAN